MSDLTELQARVQKARGDIIAGVGAGGDSRDPLFATVMAACVREIDALLAAQRALAIAEGRLRIVGALAGKSYQDDLGEWIVGWNDVLARLKEEK